MTATLTAVLSCAASPTMAPPAVTGPAPVRPLLAPSPAVRPADQNEPVPGVRAVQDLPLFVEQVRGCRLDQGELLRAVTGSSLAVVEPGAAGAFVVGLLQAHETDGLIVRCLHVTGAAPLEEVLRRDGVVAVVVDARTHGEEAALAAGARVVSREQLQAWEAWSGGAVSRLESPERAEVFRALAPSTSRLRSRAACLLLRSDVAALLRLTLEGGGTTH